MGGSFRSLQPKVTTCRSCRAPIIWVTVQKTGKRMPLDAAPSAQGTVVLLDPEHAVVLTAEEQAASIDRRYVVHFATCPQSSAWRRSRGIPDPAPAAPREPLGDVPEWDGTT